MKTGEVQDTFTAPGLPEAKERLDRLKLTPEERAEYEAYLQRLMKLAGYRETEMTDAIDLIQQGKEEKEIEAVIGFNRIGIERAKIAEALGITIEKVNQIIEDQTNQ